MHPPSLGGEVRFSGVVRSSLLEFAVSLHRIGLLPRVESSGEELIWIVEVGAARTRSKALD